MRLTEQQVRRTLRALRTQELGEFDVSDRDELRVECANDSVLADVVLRLASAPLLRPDHLARARERLATGAVLPADELANRMIGRLVCDRLR
jgi:hypothetical protein